MRTELLADAVHEQLDPAAALANVDIEVLAVGEEFAQVAEPEAPTAASFMKFFGPHILERLIAARAIHRMQSILFGHVFYSFDTSQYADRAVPFGLFIGRKKKAVFKPKA
jgi:hypothetical protein